VWLYVLGAARQAEDLSTPAWFVLLHVLGARQAEDFSETAWSAFRGS
jgi:hypothetical protein